MKALVLPGLALAALSGCVAYPASGYGYGYSEPAVYPQATFLYDSGPAYRRGGDRDRDGVANRYDRDRDGDGVRNRDDRRPNNPRRQ